MEISISLSNIISPILFNQDLKVEVNIQTTYIELLHTVRLEEKENFKEI